MAHKGRIFRETWVGCFCGEAVPLVDNYPRPQDEARARGWVLTKDKGWLCPSCAEREGRK